MGPGGGVPFVLSISFSLGKTAGRGCVTAGRRCSTAGDVQRRAGGPARPQQAGSRLRRRPLGWLAAARPQATTKVWLAWRRRASLTAARPTLQAALLPPGGLTRGRTALLRRGDCSACAMAGACRPAAARVARTLARSDGLLALLTTGEIASQCSAGAAARKRGSCPVCCGEPHEQSVVHGPRYIAFHIRQPETPANDFNRTFGQASRPSLWPPVKGHPCGLPPPCCRVVTWERQTHQHAVPG